jgi:predicted dehydrogenase
MLKVGIIGCGKIADQHAEVITRIPGCEIVGVCDREELMARQLYERFPIRNYFYDANAFLEEARPDVVHITTPPMSHFGLGKLCLEAGCSVYIEKPFTTHSGEAEELIRLATEKNLKVTPGHNYQFTHAAMQMRKLIKGGYLGGPPVHMESYYCYDLGDPAYARAFWGDETHWVRSLPGKLLQNIISHGIAKIAEFLTGDSAKVIAHGFTSPLLKKVESDMTDELRVIVEDERQTTAYFTFSSQMRPVLHQFRIYGPKNSITVDDDHQTVILSNGRKFKSYLDQFLPPLLYCRQYCSNGARNIGKFIQGKFHMDSGLRFLIESFYRAVSSGSAVPIPYGEVILTSKIMDSIFDQLNGKEDVAAEKVRQWAI